MIENLTVVQGIKNEEIPVPKVNIKFYRDWSCTAFKWRGTLWALGLNKQMAGWASDDEPKVG